jgi:hypothetical protein
MNWNFRPDFILLQRGATAKKSMFVFLTMDSWLFMILKLFKLAMEMKKEEYMASSLVF